MTESITATGLVATPVKHTITAEGLEISSFRLAASSRRFDRATQSWIEGETNWFTVTAFRHLAANVDTSIEKGHRIVVFGRLRVREWRDGEKMGREVEIVAEALGPDLAWGRAQYRRTTKQGVEPGASEAGAGLQADAAADAVDAAGFPAEAQEPIAVPF